MSFNNYAMTVIAIYNRFENDRFKRQAERVREYMESDVTGMSYPTHDNAEECLKYNVARKLLAEEALETGMKMSGYSNHYTNWIVNSIEINNTAEMNDQYMNDPVTKTIVYAYSGAQLLGCLPGEREVKEKEDGITKDEYYIHSLRYETPYIRRLVEIARFFRKYLDPPEEEVNEMVLDALCMLLTGDTVEEREKRLRAKQWYEQKQKQIEERAEEVWDEYQREVNEEESQSLTARAEAAIHTKLTRFGYD